MNMHSDRWNRPETRYKKTILVVGPPHSGKSTFAYLLFKQLLVKTDKKAYLLDCDVFSPTIERYNFNSEDERYFIRKPPNYGKLEEEVEKNDYARFIDFALATIPEEDQSKKAKVILLDGLGMHTEISEVLNSRTSKVITVCRDSFNVEKESEKYGYLLNGKASHPFDMYSGKLYLKIVSHESEENSILNPGKRFAEICCLKRENIKSGQITGIPKDALEVISGIADLILDEID